jgi:hypothetical protein
MFRMVMDTISMRLRIIDLTEIRVQLIGCNIYIYIYIYIWRDVMGAGTKKI